MMSRTSIGARAGLTLVELVVVLVILVIVAGTALTASGSLVEQTHYESSQTTLRSVERALLGHYDSASSGEDEDAISFVADVGRLPRVATAPPEFALAELWEKPVSTAAFEVQSPSGDPEVRLAVGWRGPYLHVGFGSAKLQDGWGRPYELLAADDSTAIASTEVRKIRTLGADGLAGGTDFAADATLVLESTLPTTQPARHVGAVPVRVHTSAATGENVYVRLYGPVDGDVVTLAQTDPVEATGADVVHTFTNVPIGVRIVRAYRSAAAPSTAEHEFDASAALSPIRVIRVVQGGIPEVELTLP